MLDALRPAPDDRERCFVLLDLTSAAVPVSADSTATALPLIVAEVLGIAVRRGWSGFVLVHTHPRGGAPGPSDHAVTRRLVAASAVLGVELLAHVVLAPSASYVVSGDVREPAVLAA